MIFQKTIKAWQTKSVSKSNALDINAYSIKATVLNILREVLDRGDAQSVTLEIDDTSDFLSFIEGKEFTNNYTIVQDVENPNVFTFTLKELSVEV